LPNESPCINEFAVTLADCVAQIATRVLVALPGTRFDYGNTHLHVAARMAEVVAGGLRATDQHGTDGCAVACAVSECGGRLHATAWRQLRLRRLARVPDACERLRPQLRTALGR